ncbi:MAG: hypothetical protein KDB01_21870 [Planctomycetaceae bacterium]|nr:hypothetical protein [Planctomycetaceae bacterium]
MPTVLFSAAFGVFAIAEGTAVIFCVRKAIWRRTRGYPFKCGDLVCVTDGRKQKTIGRVLAHDQAARYYHVLLNDESDLSTRCWLAANELERWNPSPDGMNFESDSDAPPSP